VLSDQLGREIEAKEHIIMLLNEEKEKNCKLTQHLNNSNRNAAESKKKLAKFELF
jgi:predicted FMN-binding regulatory protein PaiB